MRLRFVGPLTVVHNRETNGSDYVLPQTLVPNSPSNPHEVMMNPTSSATEFTTAQANAFVVLATQRDWIRDINPMDNTGEATIHVNVNMPSSQTQTACRGSWGLDDNGDHQIFLSRSAPPPNFAFCYNMAYSTLLSHEFGHALNHLYGTGNHCDGMGEGNASVWAMYVWDDPCVGLEVNGPGTCLRSGLNNAPFCAFDDGFLQPYPPPLCSNCGSDDDANGDPWMGTAWKVRTNLGMTHGEVNGDKIANALFLGWLEAYDQTKLRSKIEIQWLTLDDDDGDLCSMPPSPNYAAIDAAFRAHGFRGYSCP